MSDVGLSKLKLLLTERYDALKSQLARRLGSADLAGEALHDAYVRLAGKDVLDDVRHPQAYLLHTAVHAAIDRLREDGRMPLSEVEIEALYDLEDPTPGPVETAQGRYDLAQVVRAMEGLPPRQRDILISARLDEVSREDLAKRWGISVRQVNRELQAAHEACLRYMKKGG
jgi:RNA polymerase sigma-70 factor (ECF subfamily)